MAEPVNIVNPSTGEMGSIEATPSKLARARMTGDRPMTEAERAAVLEQRKHDQDILESRVAGYVGKARGLGESVGVPTDQLATGVADLFGKREETQKYLNDLRKYHPLASTAGEIAGQVGGGVALGETLGAGAPRIGSTLGKLAASGARAGLENVVVGTTHDINETALGNADLAGEKLLAEMPKHFAVGFGLGAAAEGVGLGLGKIGESLQKPLAESLDHGASAAVGRELGGGEALGAEIRGRMGGMPESRAGIADFLSKEQAAYREGSAASAAAARDALEAQHTTAAWEQSARGEAQRLATAKEAKAATEAVASRHAAAREALRAEHADAVTTFGELSSERDAVRKQIKGLAGDLDRVKGAERPDAATIIRNATEAFAPAEGSLTPPSQGALDLFAQWVDTFAKKHGEPGSLSFTDLHNVIDSLTVMEKRQRVVSGWGSDPDVKRAFDALKSSAKAEFDRASEATAAGVSEAKGLGAATLRGRLADLDKAVAGTEEHLDTLGSTIADFEKGAAAEVKQAERLGFQAMRNQQRTLGQQERALEKGQRAELKGLPKAEKRTPVDDLLRKARAPEEPGGLGSMGLLGAGASLLHGNVVGAAMSALGGIAAQTARAKGNLLAARTMASLAESIAKADGTIARLAGRAVGRYARASAETAIDDKAPQRPRLTFEKVSQRVRDVSANPLILEQRVRAQAGPWAQQAPGVYSSLLAAAMRSQAFLESKLPPPRTDPYSLTPHLDETELSDTEKYDFVQYAKAVADPVGVLASVSDGTVTEQQVEALKAVYPSLYGQMRTEVMRRVADLEHPLDYERSVNIGTLLELDTNEVMTGEFQSMLADMYTSRTKDEEIPGGSKPRGVNSRLSKSMSSAGQQMQMGDG